MKVKINRKSWDTKIKALKKKSKANVTVGWESDNPSVDKAMKLEYGDPNTNQPSRPFMRRAVNPELIKDITPYLKKYLHSATTAPLGMAGESVKESILEQIPKSKPKLHESTVRRKGHDEIGLDSGDMRSDITVKVNK